MFYTKQIRRKPLKEAVGYVILNVKDDGCVYRLRKGGMSNENV